MEHGRERETLQKKSDQPYLSLMIKVNHKSLQIVCTLDVMGLLGGINSGKELPANARDVEMWFPDPWVRKILGKINDHSAILSGDPMDREVYRLDTMSWNWHLTSVIFIEALNLSLTMRRTSQNS